MKNDVIELVVVKKDEDDDGFDQESLYSFEVMAEIKSVKRSEFYQAARDGINIQIVAVINLDDYKEAITVIDEKRIKPSRVIFENVLYKIIRDYRTNKNEIELTLQEVE